MKEEEGRGREKRREVKRRGEEGKGRLEAGEVPIKKGQNAAPFISVLLHLTQYLLGAESWPGRHAHLEHAETTNYTPGSPPPANQRAL